ncbi:hypothetical protein [Nitratireductor thuwali]|uniref:Uncharacterized protein n=1 Tax=Nitratireductor thuwali TaxID=2267699 RepID=A0ABY5MNC5_9HYPH|nr:hypothetical protein NTH_03993 [Nitratireductor thuwali]
MAVEIKVLAEDETGAWVTVSDAEVPYSFIAFARPGQIPDRSDEVDIEVFLATPPLNRLHLRAQSVVLERLGIAAKENGR